MTHATIPPIDPGMTASENRHWFFRGVRDALGVPAFTLAASMLGVGGLAHDVGFPLGAALFSTILIWAAPAQVIMFGLIAGGASVATLALAIGISSIRFLPMTMSILPLIRRDNTSKPVLAFIAHYVAITNWVEGMRRLPKLEKQVRLPYFLGFGNTTLLLATIATGIGYFLAGTLPRPLVAGLLFLSPIYFSTSMLRSIRIRSDLYAVVLGFVLAPLAAYYVPAGFDLLLVGLLGGTAAWYAGAKSRLRSNSSEASP